MEKGRDGAAVLLSLGTSGPVLGLEELRLRFNACHFPGDSGSHHKKCLTGTDFMWEVTTAFVPY